MRGTLVASARGYLSGQMTRGARRRAGVRVFCYHGVVEKKTDLRLERNQHLLPAFIEEIDYLRRFRVLGYPELLDEMAQSEKSRKPAAVVTFDDACVNSLLAAEVLARHRLPWFLFVPAGEVGAERALWSIDLSLLILYGRGDRIEVGDRTWTLKTREERETAFQVLRHMLKSLAAPKRAETMDRIREQFPADESARLIERFPSFKMLNWREIASLSDSGAIVGSHGLHHELHHDRQPEDVRRNELVASKALVEQFLGRPCDAFAFPNGNFVASSAHEVAQAGYSVAFTTQPGTVTSGSNPYLLPRLSAPGSLTALVREYWWVSEASGAGSSHGPLVGAGSPESAPPSEEVVAPTIDGQREFYNERWRGFEFANSLKLARAVAILDGVAASRIKEPKILDLGCGSGWLTAIVGAFGPATGVELSDEAVKTAAARYDHIEVIRANIFDWNYPRESFDIVISQEVIEHVPDQAEYVRIAHSLLRSGGYLILTTPNAETLDAMEPEQSAEWSQQPIEALLSREQLRTLLKAQFRIERMRTIVPNFGAAGIRRIVNSYSLRQVFSAVGLGDAFDAWRLWMGYGLHTVVIAQRR